MFGILEFLKIDLKDKSFFLFDTFESHTTDFKSKQDVQLGRNIYYAEKI